MKYAIISDIHGNLEALEAVLGDISTKDVDKTFCLGDIVGYGANPNECIELIKENCIDSVKGNHDAASVGEMPLSWFNGYAFRALRWTGNELTSENKAFLKNLNSIKTEGNLILCHSSLYAPEKFNYVRDKYDVEFLVHSGKKISDWDKCFIGHTHVPKVFKVNESGGNLNISSLGLKDLEDSLDFQDSLYVINVGSVGQPRDRNWKSSYMTYDLNNQKLDYFRVEYELAKAQIKIVDAGLPIELSKRLEFGR